MIPKLPAAIRERRKPLKSKVTPRSSCLSGCPDHNLPVQVLLQGLRRRGADVRPLFELERPVSGYPAHF